MHDKPLTYEIIETPREGTVIIKLVGPLTLLNLFTIQDQLRAIHPPVAIFDFTESEYMDSAGLGLLINFYTSAEKNGRTLALAGVNHRIDALLEMTHVKKLLNIHPTVEQALAAV